MARGKSLGHTFLFVTLMVMLGGGLVAAPPSATRPTTVPVAADEVVRARDVFDGLLRQGTDALAARDYAAAQALLGDARQVFERQLRVKVLPPGGPEHVAVLQGLALAYVLGDAPDKALLLFREDTPLDRACAAKNAPRQLLLTRAFLDLTESQLAMRTAVGLSNYLKNHPDELDGELLDVLCTAIIVADDQVTGRGTLGQVIDTYEEFSQRLEATRPGQRRWGVKWVSEGEFNSQLEQRNKAIKTYQDAMHGVYRAVDNVDRARHRLWDAQVFHQYKGLMGQRFQEAKDYQSKLQADAAMWKSRVPAIPALTRDELLHIVEPHEVDVIAAPKPPPPDKAAAPVTPAAPDKPVAAVKPAAGPPVKPRLTQAAGGGGGPHVFSREAMGFAIGPELLLTATSAVDGARRVTVDLGGGQRVEASVERTSPEGLALLRVEGQKLAYLNPAARAFAGGAISCPSYPDVRGERAGPEEIAGKALAPIEDKAWKIALARHPRLAGAPLLNPDGEWVGVELGERGDPSDRLPAVSLDVARQFLGVDLPRRRCPTPTAAIVRVTASFER